MPDPAPKDSARLTAADIFELASSAGESELKRSSPNLAFSGLAAGLVMGLTALGVAILEAALGEASGARVVAALLYPVGFVAVVIGRAQLFTENTLFPIIKVLDERSHLVNAARLWVIVLATNLVGALLFAVLAMRTGALDFAITDALAQVGRRAAEGSFVPLFWSGVIGGWVIALMAWIVTASRGTFAQIAVVWVLAFLIGAGGVAHCIAGTTEILSAVMGGTVSWVDYLAWLAPATLGNIVGGVVMVSLLNYAQVIGSGRELEQRSLEAAERELTGVPAPRERVRDRG